MNETITVKDGQAAVTTTAVSGTLSPKSSATDIITVVKTENGDQAAVKVVDLGGGGGGGADYSQEINALENAASVLTTSVELSTEIGGSTTVLFDELISFGIDGRPDYKAPGATVYAENGAVGIIDTVDTSMQTAVVKTVSFAGGLSSAEVEAIENALDSINGESV